VHVQVRRAHRVSIRVRSPMWIRLSARPILSRSIGIPGGVRRIPTRNRNNRSIRVLSGKRIVTHSGRLGIRGLGTRGIALARLALGRLALARLAWRRLGLLPRLRPLARKRIVLRSRLRLSGLLALSIGSQSSAAKPSRQKTEQHQRRQTPPRHNNLATSIPSRQISLHTLQKRLTLSPSPAQCYDAMQGLLQTPVPTYLKPVQNPDQKQTSYRIWHSSSARQPSMPPVATPP
jgi:hypothetical protein